MEPFHGRADDWDGHLLLLHHTEAQRRTGVAAWVRHGLEVGAKILYTERRDKPRAGSLRQLLHEEHVAAEVAIERGQLRIVQAAAGSFDPSWQACVIEDALEEGYPSVRWSGEAQTAWSVLGRAAHRGVEWATDELCRSHPLSVLCQYSTTSVGDDLPDVCASHGAGLRVATLRFSPIADGVSVAGEVDFATKDILRAALLAATPPDWRTPYTVDLSDLQFLDVSGARSLTTGTSGYRHRGGHVRLRSAPLQVERLLRVLSIGNGAGFSVDR